MIKLTSTKADIAKEQDGDWVEIPDLPGIALRVRSIHSKAFAVARDLASRKLATRYGNETVPEDDLARVNGQLYADHLLLEWRGFDVPYSPEVAADTLTDPAYRDLRRHVIYAAAQVGRANVEFLEGVAKNSEAPSAGA
jgi:hypothetical protein